MTVYFIQAGEDGPIKIGCTLANPWARLASCQVVHYADLRLIALIEGGFPLENELHERFAEHRIRGEWFRAHPSVLALAAQHPVVKPPPKPRRKPEWAGLESFDFVAAERAMLDCGVSVRALCTHASVRVSTWSYWKSGRSRPRRENASRVIAAIDHLSGGALDGWAFLKEDSWMRWRRDPSRPSPRAA